MAFSPIRKIFSPAEVRTALYNQQCHQAARTVLKELGIPLDRAVECINTQLLTLHKELPDVDSKIKSFAVLDRIFENQGRLALQLRKEAEYEQNAPGKLHLAKDYIDRKALFEFIGVQVNDKPYWN